ncbi:hypothetical protein ACX6XY_19975 [Streptomyces sp. O3]
MSRNKPTRGNSSTSVAGEPAAIYCRISQADDDDQTGGDRQERICREIAERRGLVIDALTMAAGRGRLQLGCIAHSDRGSEYTAAASATA